MWPPMDTAAEVAARFGEATSTRDELGFAFGPTALGLYRMDLARDAVGKELRGMAYLAGLLV
jgi:hypothetical protein